MTLDPLKVSRGITDLPAPSLDPDAATKKYVDDALGGVPTLPDPSGEPDGQWLRTASGAAVWMGASAGDYQAGDIINVPAGGISATNVQSALNELDTEKLSVAVTSLAKSGSAALTGAVTLTGGANVTLTQAGNDISIAASGGGAVSSVFTRTGAVVAADSDYYGVVAAALSGATQTSRYVGATTSGAPASGTFATGDFVIARDGHIFLCTAGGSPGTWVDAGSYGGASFGTPAVVLGTAAAAGSASTAVRTDATIVAFDTTAPSTQAFGDAAAVGTATVAARRDHKHAMPSLPAGSMKLVYRKTISGADAASIDTGVDAADAGDNDWTNGDLLEIYFYARTDEAVASSSSVSGTFNNDSSAIYDLVYFQTVNATTSGGNSLGNTQLSLNCAGSSNGANVFAAWELKIPNYMGTTGYKQFNAQLALADPTAANNKTGQIGFLYRSTSALTRFKVVPATSGKKLKVGSQLVIYKRTAA